MTDPVFGLTAGAAKVLQEMADKHRQRLPAVGRRVRRIGQKGGGDVKVIGPCVVYTPDIGDPDTDFETAYPGGCDGPDVLGLNIKNLATGITTVVRMELESTGPLKISSGSFTLACKGSSFSAYAEIVFNDLDSTATTTTGVVCTIFKVSDDSVVQTFINKISSYDPLLGGNLQIGPTNTSCDCGTLPFNLCLSIPTR